MWGLERLWCLFFVIPEFMGHGNLLNAPQMYDTEPDQGWNHGQHPYVPTVRSAPESLSTGHPVDSMSGGHFHSQWAPASMTSGFSSFILNCELPNHEPKSSCPPRDLISCQTSAVIPHEPQENCLHHPSSSNVVVQPVPGSDGSFNEQVIRQGRGSNKRKNPFPAPTFDRPYTSKHSDVGSSSDMHLPGDRWHEYQCNHREYMSSYGVNGLYLDSEGTQRYMRTGAGVDNLPWTCLPSNFSNYSFSNLSSGRPCEIMGQNSNASWGWDRTSLPTPAHGMASSTDPSFAIHVPSSLNSQNSRSNSLALIGSYINDIPTHRNHNSQNITSHVNQSSRVSRNGYRQRSGPSFRAYSSSNRPGHFRSREEPQTLAENYPSQHARTVSNLRLGTERNGRTSASADRYRYFANDPAFRDRSIPGGPVAINQPLVFYGSRAMFDQYRDMRLDVDNMTYEELLALGERIGTVNTGLSNGSIAKCLIESIYCSSDAAQDEENCVICLEDYKNMDDVGSLKACCHDFHVGCIRKWLSIKNLCPICKSTAMDDYDNYSKK